MKFRKFFKSNDSLNVSLFSEKRHYMDYSGIASDRFPAPLPVLNVLNMVGKKVQVPLFAWILGEGLRLASIARRELAEWASVKLSEKYGRPVEIPQKAIFSKEAAQEIPELSAEWPELKGSGVSTQEYLEKMWMRQGGEPDNIKIGKTTIPLAQINAYLLRQGKTPLIFGGPDGLMEYIEKGDWRSGSSSEAYPRSSITKYGKKGIELALDPGDKGIRPLEDGRKIIALGRDPKFSKEIKRHKKAISGKEEIEALDNHMRSNGREFIRIPEKPAETKQIIYRKEGTEDIVYDVVTTIENGQKVVKWVPVSKNVHSGSYVVSNTKSPEWRQWLDDSRRESFRKIKQIYNDVKSGKEISDEDNYVAKMLKDGSLTDVDFETVSAKMQKVIGLTSRNIKLKGSQVAGGTGPDGLPTYEEWLKYKAAAKMHIMNILSIPPEDTSWGTYWGERAGIENPILGVSSDGSRSKRDLNDTAGRNKTPAHEWKLDLNNPQYVGYTEDKAKREKIADELLDHMFDDEKKSIRTRVIIYRKPFPDYRDKKTATFYSVGKGKLTPVLSHHEVIGRISDEEILEYIGQGWKTDPPMDPEEIRSQRKIKLVSPDGSESVDFIRDKTEELWMQVASASEISVDYNGEKQPPIKADTIFDDLLNFDKSVVKVPGHQFGSSKVGKPISQEEIQNYINNDGFVPAYFGLHDSNLQLRNPKTGEEMLFYTRTKNKKNLYYPVESPKQTKIENPLVSSPWPSVNTGVGFQGTMAGKNHTEEWQHYLKNPKEYGTTETTYDGVKMPSEIKSAAWKVHGDKVGGMKPHEILSRFYSEAIESISRLTGDIQFKFGELSYFDKKVEKELRTNCKNCNSEGEKKGDDACEVCNGLGFIPPNIEKIKTLKDFIKENVYKGQKETKEMKGSENLQSVLNADDGPIAGIDENGNVVLRRDIYKALLKSGKLWRQSKAISAFITAFNREVGSNSIELKTRGQGGGQSEEDGPNALDNLSTEDDPVEFEDDGGGEDRWSDEFASDDEREDNDSDYDIYGDTEDDFGQEFDPDNDGDKKAADAWLKQQGQKRANVSRVAGTKDSTPSGSVGFDGDLGSQIPNASSPVIGGSPKLKSTFKTQAPAKKTSLPSLDDLRRMAQEDPPLPSLDDLRRMAQEDPPLPSLDDLRRMAQEDPPLPSLDDLRRMAQNENFSSFQRWLETGPYDSRVAKQNNRTFNVWGAPPEGKVPQKSIDGEADTAKKDPTGSKGVKSGRKQKA